MGDINISGNQGDVFGVGVSGSHNVFSKHSVGSAEISLTAEQLSRVAPEFASGLKAFSESINAQLRANKVPAQAVAPVQKEVEALAKEVEQIKPEAPVTFSKKAEVTSRFTKIVQGLLKVLPSTAETVAAFTPLAPFSKVIGTGVQEIVKAVQSEG